MEGPVFEGAAHHQERQSVAAFQRYAAGGAGEGEAGQRVDARHAILHQPLDARRLGETLTGERHSHGQHVLRVEARVHRAQRDGSPDEQGSPDQEHYGEDDFADFP